MNFKNDEYASYMSSEKLNMRHRDLFCDKEGYPNEKAFMNFNMTIKENEDFRLVCMTVDLQKSNLDPDKGYSYGNYVLRKLIISLEEKGFFVFRIQGAKFNILAEASQIEKLKEKLDKESEDYNIYYGIVDEPYFWKRNMELIEAGKNLMYQNRDAKLQQAMAAQRTENDKGNTPVELQETATRKYRSTMWYSTVHIKMTEPEVRELTIYVFPTERMKPLETIPLIAVTDDMLNCHLKNGKMIEFGLSGIKFMITARFDRGGHLNLMVQNATRDRESKEDIKIDTKEGVCFPASFGKRIGDEKEIYPFKKDANGMYQYVLLDKETGDARIVDTGVVTMNDKEYTIHMDEECIDLIPMKEE